ncbi:PREDICTED: solute carrier family 2, facilitated glucose transporter member 1-like [Priapulus caudatus]|uniref:Solute carrier family 2, facilitated glucose transporter member 1-like n=1 Tax=Priapulus caudatus TaxID=37621 RepID=A0ABM1EM43_PRICU|nr:PREDICTED: solute carrier family 2, facilitated glucose transporter member 1-like [Priapulus caudatus]
MNSLPAIPGNGDIISENSISDPQTHNALISRGGDGENGHSNKDATGRLTWPLLFAAIVVTLGSSFQFGWNTGVINSPGKVIQEWYREIYRKRHGYNFSGDPNVTTLAPGDIDKNMLDALWSVTVSMFAVGGMIGGITTGFWTDKFGSKKTLLSINALAILGGALEFSSRYLHSYEVLIFGRLIIGINSGLVSGAAPLYLTEIAPVNLRGELGSSHQFVVTIAILLSQILGLPMILGNAEYWPVLFALTIVPAVGQLVLLPTCPESPRYLLLTRQQATKAQNVLVRLRQTVNVHGEMEEMKRENDRLLAKDKVSFVDVFKKRYYRMPIIITIVMMLSQQLSGINAVFYYSTRVFEEGAGISPEAAVYATIGVGVANVIMSLVSVLLIDKLGRRTLHLLGLSGMEICTIVLTISLVLLGKGMSWATWICILAVFFFVVSFATGPGSIPWFIAGELFDQAARPMGMTVGVVTNWAANFLVGLCFPLLQNVIDEYIFLIFSAFLLVFIIFTWQCVPETKNRTVEDITAKYRRKSIG